MKLTKLLMGAVLAVAAMTFVACEPDNPADKPAKEYAFERNFVMFDCRITKLKY